eukprot:1842111-Rhodomonas_salina.1
MISGDASVHLPSRVLGTALPAFSLTASFDTVILTVAHSPPSSTLSVSSSSYPASSLLLPHPGLGKA